MRPKKKITSKPKQPTIVPETARLLRGDFASFVRKAYAFLHGGARLESETLYIEYVCTMLVSVATGETKRAVFNMPPKHLKTFIGSVCLPAWIIMREPSTKVMLIAGSEGLVEEMARQLRKVLFSSWFSELSGLEPEQDHNKVLDFSVGRRGGKVSAFSIGSSITGRGADLIIVDDPVDIGKAGDVEHLEKINQLFQTRVLSRLNNPKEGRVVVIAHRLSPNDLSGSLLKLGGWHHIALPLVATEDTVCETGHGPWHRKALEPLRPKAFTESYIEGLRANTHNPDFETFYQQDVSGGLKGRISRDHFPRFEPRDVRGLPIVVSVDPGDSGGPNNSFSVIQAWCWDRGESYYLVDQFREQCGYREFRRAYQRFVFKHQPSVALIEATGQGKRLLEDEQGKGGKWPRLEKIIPVRRSKVARFRPHVPSILEGRVWLPRDAHWVEGFISENVAFPNGGSDDQVDALTQALDFFSGKPELALRPARANAVVASKSAPGVVGPHARNLDGQARGVVVTASRRGFLY
jgi:predicted phage terminase large subunit-like protein